MGFSGGVSAEIVGTIDGGSAAGTGCGAEATTGSGGGAATTAGAGIDARSSTPVEFHDRVASDIKRWAEVVKKAKIPVE